MREDLEYQLAKPLEEDFIPIPSLKSAIAKTKARAANGEILHNISWYQTKLLIQNLGPNYFLPTSAEWDTSRKYLQQFFPEYEKDFITGECEWVDSLIAFPDENQNYSSTLQIPDIKKGKVPLLIEKSRVERYGNDYIITDGKVTEVPNLPTKDGFVQEWDEELGLPTKVGRDTIEGYEEFEGAFYKVDTEYSYDKLLRAVVRGPWFFDLTGERYTIATIWSPAFSYHRISFRLGKVMGSYAYAQMQKTTMKVRSIPNF